MNHGDRDLVVSFIKLFDLFAMTTAFILAAAVSYAYVDTLSFSEFLSMRVKVQNFALFSGFLLLWHGVFSAVGVYARGRLELSGRGELISVVKATSYGAMTLWLATALANVELMTITGLFVFWAVACGVSTLGRMVLRWILQWRARARGDRSHLVIVGTNERAIELARKITAHPEVGYYLVGFVDEHWSGDTAFRESGHTVVSDFKGFQDYLRDHVIDEVIICTPIKSLYDSSYRILRQCEQQGVTVRISSNLFTPISGSYRVDRLEEQTVLTINAGEMRGPGMIIKRFLDFFVSLTTLLLLLPMLLAVAIAIKIDSSGPILFIQERVGLNKRRFRLYKFRTMVDDAEMRLAELEHCNEVSGPVFKIKRDPRITRVGEFLRKSSLDELPQLINVIKGDMSLVGPRPLPVRDYRGFTENWHRRRFSVRPGITCLWQVCGRSSIPFERWMELDMQYIDQWSLMLDFKILLKTIPAVVKGSGAS
jgi:exopolysaccharide biosynthesis polyprenyl glycosylphosphotransferase